jgi:hypothetical protein
VNPTQFVIDPFYVVKEETVIEKTTGSETTASLAHGNLYGDLDRLYTWKTSYSNKIQLVRGTDYTVTTAGVITFLAPLVPDTTLYADYRWVGTTLGPFTVPDEFHYVNSALPGVSLCFSNQLEVGNRMVVIVYPKREPAAMVYSGHYRMSFDVDVVAKDPIQLADLTDQVISYIWSYRRLQLINEGLTIEEFDPTGESEEAFDENTGDLYYKNSLNMQIMTEWKKFVPFLTEILDFDTQLYQYINQKDYIVTDQDQTLELKIKPTSEPFEVIYPQTGFPRYF